MCGFAGIIKSNSEACNDELIQMSSDLRHRGPDSLNLLMREGWALAHARLKIVDLSDNGNQPMTDNQNQWHLVFNGEIYNSELLKKEFGFNEKYSFKSQSDAEILLPLLQEGQLHFLEKLSGIFSFAAHDSLNGQTILVRDQLGVKPLYYSITNEGLYFSSEIKSLLSLKKIVKVINWQAMNTYFSLGYFLDEQTPYQNIFQLPAGSYLKYAKRTKTIEICKYFTPALVKQDKIQNNKKLISDLKIKILNSFKLQMKSDVPIGLMLSGGMDSSVLASMYHDYAQNDIFHTYTIKFEKEEFDESSNAQKMADWTHSNHHEVIITAQSYREHYHEALSFMDQPTSDSSFVPTFLLAKRASQDVKVLLSGDGGDEFFAGYETIIAARWRQYYLKLPQWVRHNVIGRIVQNISPDYNKTSFISKIKLFLKGVDASLPVAHFLWRECISLEMKKQLFRGDLARKLEGASAEEGKSKFCKRFYEPENWDDVNRQLLLDATYHFTDKLQVKTDRMTMAWSIETRVPLADIELVKFLLSIPGKEKIKNGELKHLLKSAFKDDLPKGWTKKKKSGLIAPVSMWMREEWKDWMDEVFLHSDDWIDVLDKESVKKLWLEHKEGKNDWGQVLFTILGFIEWRRIQLS